MFRFPLGRHHRRFGIGFGLALMLSFSGMLAAQQLPNQVTAGGLNITAKVFTPTGAVPPGGAYPIILFYRAGDAGSSAVAIDVTLHEASIFQSSIPAAASSNGNTYSYVVAPLAAGIEGKIVINAAAKDLSVDPQVMWKSIFANVSVTAVGEPAQLARTRGPKVTDLASARFGDRPFPVVMVEYQDVSHCTGAGTPFPECASNHTAERLNEAVNSKTSGTSLWQLYQDMSFGQLFPDGKVSPAPGSGTVAFDPAYNHQFSQPAPAGTCNGTTLAATPTYPSAVNNRIVDGWYVLPGTQGYYGADTTGHGAAGSLTGQGLLAGIDDACGPTGKIVFDAASLADPDIDYNELDTDKDGVVDFFNLMFAGDGGNGSATPSGLNNVWPHKSDLQYYFTDPTTGLRGYISNDRLKNLLDEPLFYTDETYAAFTTTDTGLPAYVRVGPYNVNPESAVDTVSVVGHEYGHSLGLPDFYSTGGRDTYGAWTLMASDYFQFMDVFSRQEMGWIVPQRMPSGSISLRESKFDTGEIRWHTPDGTPYTLTGEGIHNADAYRLGLPTDLLIEAVPSGSRAWFSQAGNDYPCPPDANGHYLDVFVPELQSAFADASAVTMTFQSRYDIEWDYDYAFVMISTDGGDSWVSLPSSNGTTLTEPFNPNGNACNLTYGNAITGVSGAGPNTVANPSRLQGEYPEAVFMEDAFDLSAYAGESVILRFAYMTDGGLARPGWFIDDLKITADGETVYATDFEAKEETRIFPSNWSWASSSDVQNVDHAYYLSLRDRLSFDFDGKGQSERGGPGWQGGVYLMLTDEGHGYGNTGSSNPPPQTPVDAAPEPLNDTPNLDDAAFTLERPNFNGCTHVDNYSADAGGTVPWKLPADMSFVVDSLVGLAPGPDLPATPATANLTINLYPDCDLELLPPVLSIASGYEDPDKDGAFSLSWQRPVGAVGPDTLQEATQIGTLLADDAEELLTAGSNSNWSGSPQWISQIDPDTGSMTYYVPNGASQDEALTLVNPIQVPVGDVELLFQTRQGLESGYDFGLVEVSADNGASFTTVASYSGPAGLGGTPADVFVGQRRVDLSDYSGQSILLRFRITSDTYNEGQPAGWYIDNIVLETSNFADKLVTDQSDTLIQYQPVGSYFYRVRTSYSANGVALASGYSNVVAVDVAATTQAPVPTATPGPVQTPAPTPGLPGQTPAPAVSGARGGALGLWMLLGLVSAISLRQGRRRKVF